MILLMRQYQPAVVLIVIKAHFGIVHKAEGETTDTGEERKS